MKIIKLAILLVPMFVCSQALGQARADLDLLENRVSTHVQSKFKEWTHKRVQPFFPGSDVLVEFWHSPNRTVKIAVVVHQSTDKAKEEVRSFVSTSLRPEHLKGFGEEAYTLGMESSDIIMRRGRYVIYVNTWAVVEDDADARSLTEPQLLSRRKSEQQRIGKEFARQLLDVELPSN